MKKSIFLFVTLMAIGMFCTGQTYYTIYLDSLKNKARVPYPRNNCEFLKVIMPKGAIMLTWETNGEPFQVEDGNIVVKSGYGYEDGGLISCKYNSDVQKKSITVYALITPPSETNLKDTMVVLDGKPMLVDAKNYSKYGFTKYQWSNGATTQIVYLEEGIHTVTVSNVCGSWTRTIVVLDKTPARYK